MFSRISVLGFTTFLIVSSAAAQSVTLPKRIQASYVVSKNGMPFAKVHEQYSATGHNYHVESITKGIGVYALMGERKLISTGNITSQGLMPVLFELQQGRNANKTVRADFDWTQNSLHLLVKGTPQALALGAGTQDLASYAYQFMFLPRPIKESVTVTLTTGKKVNTYPYLINEEPLNIAGTSYKTVHLTPTNQSASSVERKELWLDTERNYLMLKFVMVDEDGTKLEQMLTELHVD